MIFRLALRNLVRQRRLSALSLLSIAISVMLMIDLIAFVNGLESLLTDTVIHKTTGAVQVHKKGFVDNVRASPFGFTFALSDELRQRIEGVHGVKATTERIVFAGLLSVGDQSFVSPIVAIDPEREHVVCPLGRQAIASGAPVARGGLLVSPEVARRVAGAKQVITLAQDGDGVLNAAELAPTGVLDDIPLLFANKRLVYMALADAQALLRLDDRVLEVAIAVDDPREAEVVKTRVRAVLPAELEVHTWQERSAGLVKSLEQRRMLFNFLTRVFLVLALIGVANTMLMSVIGRVREIGTMMALGTSRWFIARLFLGEALLLGAVGGLLGIAAGVLTVSWFSHHGFLLDMPGATKPSLVYPWIAARECMMPFVLVVIGALVAALHPAVKATRLAPVQALGPVGE